MRVLFIYPVPQERFQILRFQQGIGSISAVLKKAGHETDLLIVSTVDRDQIGRRVTAFRPGLVALSLTSGFFRMGTEIAGIVGKEHRIPVILGGVHPTLCPEDSIAVEGVSAICRGEGEYPMLEFCAALEGGGDPTGIQNLWVKKGDGIFRNDIRPLIADLDSLPFPDREIFRFGDMIKVYAEAEFMGSRGCPYKCAYCVNHALVELYRGKGAYVRFRSVDNLLNEVAQVMERFPGIWHLGFHDDTFTLNPRWLKEFAEKYPARCKKPFWCNATASSITPEVVGLLKQAGCMEVRIGVESGNDKIRKEILQKDVAREEIVRAFSLLREGGVATYAFNMVGLPYETPETLQETIRLNQEIRPKNVFCSVFQPYPGTKAYEICRDNGWITGKAVGSYFEADYTIEQPTISRREVLFYYDIFRDIVRWPRLTWLIVFLARIRVTRTKSLWNAWRRVVAIAKQMFNR